MFQINGYRSSGCGNGPRIGIHILNPGLKSRVAPHRMNKKIADALCRFGYPVLRSDPAGIGDSEGELPDLPVQDLWGQIQQGIFVEDTREFNDRFREMYSLDRLVLAGACGGSITALLTAADSGGIDGLVLIDLPLTVSSTKTEGEDYKELLSVDGSSRERMATYYFRKAVLNPRSLMRFFSFKSDYGAILQVARLKLKEMVLGKRDEAVVTLKNMNPLIVDSCSKFFSAPDARACFICAEKDPHTRLFEKAFRNVYLGPGGRFEAASTVVTIPMGNHLYSEETAQKMLVESIAGWVTARFPLCPEEVSE